jgi:repressor LexA
MEGEKMKMLGYRIKLVRLSKGMSQEELANKCGNHSNNARSWISKIESGNRNPNIDDIYKIADALDVEVSILFMEGEPSDKYYNKLLRYMVLFGVEYPFKEGEDQ